MKLNSSEIHEMMLCKYILKCLTDNQKDSCWHVDNNQSMEREYFLAKKFVKYKQKSKFCVIEISTISEVFNVCEILRFWIFRGICWK